MNHDNHGNRNRADLLADARQMRHLESSLVLLRLIRLRIEELKEELVERRGAGSDEIRGAIMELRSLVSAVENDPPRNEKKDGAYA